MADSILLFDRENRRVRRDRVNAGTAARPGAWTGADPARLDADAVPFGIDWKKRSVDIVLALFALAVAAPAMLLIALAIKIGSPGPIFFFQTRHGLAKRPFRICKFRTMHIDACRSPEVIQATRNDARVTMVGRLLRSLSLDELPQLFNVLRGEMSLVGPRPHAMAHDDSFACLVPGYDLRFRVPPGITGLAQINGLRGEIRTRDALQARIEADLFYVRHRSLGLDMRILLATLFLIWTDKAAY